MATQSKPSKKVVPFRSNTPVKTSGSDVNSSCEEIKTIGLDLCKDIRDKAVSMGKGKLAIEQAKVAAQMYGHSGKVLGHVVQAEHARQNRRQTATIIAAQDRDNANYQGLQVDLMLATDEAIRTGDSTGVHKLVKKSA